MIVNLPFRMPFRVLAVTVWPVVLVSKSHEDLTAVERMVLFAHENVHLEQQRRWAVCSAGVGLLAWWFLYLFVLPCYWNPFRRKWETEAYRLAENENLDVINYRLRQAPYWLKR